MVKFPPGILKDLLELVKETQRQMNLLEDAFLVEEKGLKKRARRGENVKELMKGRQDRYVDRVARLRLQLADHLPEFERMLRNEPFTIEDENRALRENPR